MPSEKADYSVEIVTDSGQADATVVVVDGISNLSPVAGDSLFFDGTVWQDRPIADGDIPAAIARDSEVASAYVAKSLFDANTVLAATTDDTPAALTVGASTIVGRKASGGIAALTPNEVSALQLEPWIAVTGGVGYQNSWADLGGQTGARYRRMGSRVFLGGVSAGIAGAGKGNATVVYTLPAGYRPAVTQFPIVFGQRADGVPLLTYLLIGTDGTILVTTVGQAANTAVPALAYDGVSFFTDA